MHAPVTRPKLERFQRLLDEAKRRQARKEQSEYGWYDENGVRQGGLIAFVRYFWSILEPETPFVDGWPLWAMCEHLEAVTAGKLTRLLMNVPPGSMKSLLVNVFWPAWEWGPKGFSHLRYVTFSYSASLTERDNGKFRDLVTSEPYQRLYGFGERGVRLRNKTTLKVHNTRTGWKLASSVGGVGTGERGDRIILDDPHNVKDAESETVRTETVRWFRESLSSRFNNAETAFVIIMQRVHEDDVSGMILTEGLDYVHLMIPMEYEWERQTDADGDPIATAEVKWVDPRYVPAAPDECNGTLAWEERFSPDLVERLKKELGPYAWAGQYQQRPAPRGGGIFKREWWQLWAPDNGKFPVFDYIMASLDSAFTEKEQNDPSALTIWGVFSLPETDIAGGEVDEETGQIWHRYTASRQRIMLVHAWRKHLQFSGPRFEREENEIIKPGMPAIEKRVRNDRFLARTRPHWGLVEWVRHTCTRFNVHKLLIEAKASGMSAADELRNRYGDATYSIETCQVKGDKIARAYAAQPTFSNLLVYAPDRDWADMVISEMEVFPKGKYKDLTDSTTQAISHLRAMGLAQTDEETTSAEMQTVMHRPKRAGALYPV
jgi:predicted phage terminase large subunit-like protein